jgi:hypothetical protein
MHQPCMACLLHRHHIKPTTADFYAKPAVSPYVYCVSSYEINSAGESMMASSSRNTATSGANRRTSLVAHRHVLTQSASASRVYKPHATQVNATRSSQHSLSAVSNGLEADLQPILKPNQPIVHISTAQAATKFIM